MINKIIEGKFKFPIVKDTKGSITVRMNCKGMMKIIERSIKQEDRHLLLQEYAKFWLADKLGIKELPLKK